MKKNSILAEHQTEKTFTALKFLRVSTKTFFLLFLLFYVGTVMYRYFALQIFIIFQPRFRTFLFWGMMIVYTFTAECSFQRHKNIRVRIVEM